MSFRRLSENTVAAALGALAFAIATTGTAVAVSASNVAVTDIGTGVHAHVDSDGRLLVGARPEAARYPYTMTVSGGFDAGTPLSHSSFATSSHGFVVDTVSGYVDVPTGQTLSLHVALFDRPTGAADEIQIPLQYKDVRGGYDHWAFTFNVAAFNRPNAQLYVSGFRPSTAGTVSFQVTLFGHLA